MEGRSSQRHQNIPTSSDRHAILHFNLERDETKFKSLVKKRILETYHLQSSRMHNMKQWLELVVPDQWRRVFAIDCIPYKELVLEFFSTFSINLNNPDVNYPSIIFQLGGKMRCISLREFALRLGIYTNEEIDLGKLGVWQPVDEFEIFKFWKRLVDNNREFKVMYMTDSRHRILHQLISAALFGYREITGNLNNTDMRIMYSFLARQYLCPAMYIARACEEKFSGYGSWNTPIICGGKIVTKLAESYELHTMKFLSTLQPVGRVHILDIRSNKRLTEINEPDHKFWVLVHDASPNDTPSQEIDIETTHVETSELVSDQLVLKEQLAFQPGSSSFQGASSSVPENPSLNAWPEDQNIPSFQALLELEENSSPLDLSNFPELPILEIESHVSMDDLFREISPKKNFYLGESSTQQGAQTYQKEIPQLAPIAQAPTTLEDIVREVREIKKDLTDLTAWLKNRFPDP